MVSEMVGRIPKSFASLSKCNEALARGDFHGTRCVLDAHPSPLRGALRPLVDRVDTIHNEDQELPLYLYSSIRIVINLRESSCTHPTVLVQRNAMTILRLWARYPLDLIIRLTSKHKSEKQSCAVTGVKPWISYFRFQRRHTDVSSEG